jgi:hypothetical protein
MSHNFPGSSYFFRHAIFLVQFLQEIAPVVKANNVPSFKFKKKREKKMYSQVLTSTLKKLSLEKARKKKKKRKKNFCRNRLYLHTMTFKEQILHVQDYRNRNKLHEP